MKNRLLLIILFSFCLITCNKKEDNPKIKEDTSLVIKAGFICGWGSGQDSLIISGTMIKYFYSVPANTQIPEVNKARPTTPGSLLRIIQYFIRSDLDWALKLTPLNPCRIFWPN
jgi:hypothetical protein